MSYASGLARLTPVAGLWSTAIPALIYGALGTCRYIFIITFTLSLFLTQNLLGNYRLVQRRLSLF